MYLYYRWSWKYSQLARIPSIQILPHMVVQGFSIFPWPGTTFILSYQLTGHKVMYGDGLLKRHRNLLTRLERCTLWSTLIFQRWSLPTCTSCSPWAVTVQCIFVKLKQHAICLIDFVHFFYAHLASCLVMLEGIISYETFTFVYRKLSS
jgi:hypothetical protein